MMVEKQTLEKAYAMRTLRDQKLKYQIVEIDREKPKAGRRLSPDENFDVDYRRIIEGGLSDDIRHISSNGLFYAGYRRVPKTIIIKETREIEPTKRRAK